MRRFDEIRNCTNLGILMGEIERIAVTHRHWDHMAGLPAAIDAIVGQGGRVSVHVDPDMFNERAVRPKSGTVIPLANVPSPAELERHGAIVVNNPDERLLLDRHVYYSGEIPGSASSRRAVSTTLVAPAPIHLGNRIRS